MVISSTSAVLASIQAVSPESSFGGASSANAGAAARMVVARAVRPQLKRGRFIASVSLGYFSNGAMGRTSSGPYDPAQGVVAKATCSERGDVGFTGADPHRSFHIKHKNLAVADFAGIGGLGDRLDHAVGE